MTRGGRSIARAISRATQSTWNQPRATFDCASEHHRRIGTTTMTNITIGAHTQNISGNRASARVARPRPHARNSSMHSSFSSTCLSSRSALLIAHIIVSSITIPGIPRRNPHGPETNSDNRTPLRTATDDGSTCRPRQRTRRSQRTAPPAMRRRRPTPRTTGRTAQPRWP
jgi:hypothetical protein